MFLNTYNFKSNTDIKFENKTKKIYQLAKIIISKNNISH